MLSPIALLELQEKYKAELGISVLRLKHIYRVFFLLLGKDSVIHGVGSWVWLQKASGVPGEG